MNIFSLILISLALSADCLAICLIYGMQRRAFKSALKPEAKDPFPCLWLQALKMAVVFTFFHVAMISLGWIIGTEAISFISVFDHWVAFGLLAFIGIKMIIAGFNTEKTKMMVNASHQMSTLILLGLATSIDALAIGVSSSFENVKLGNFALILSIAVFTTTMLGVICGNRIKSFAPKTTYFIGGLILIGIGIRILIEHEFGYHI